MSTQNNTNRKEAASSRATSKKHEQLAALEPALLQECASIIAGFNNHQLSFTTTDVRTLIFHVLHDQFNNARNSIITANDVATMYYLWELLGRMDMLMPTYGFPHEEYYDRILEQQG